MKYYNIFSFSWINLTHNLFSRMSLDSEWFYALYVQFSLFFPYCLFINKLFFNWGMTSVFFFCLLTYFLSEITMQFLHLNNFQNHFLTHDSCQMNLIISSDCIHNSHKMMSFHDFISHVVVQNCTVKLYSVSCSDFYWHNDTNMFFTIWFILSSDHLSENDMLFDILCFILSSAVKVSPKFVS